MQMNVVCWFRDNVLFLCTVCRGIFLTERQVLDSLTVLGAHCLVGQVDRVEQQVYSRYTYGAEF